MTAELREMQRLGISTMNIAQFPKAVREGRRPSERAYALKNLEWLSGLGITAGQEAAFEELRRRYDKATARTAEAAKKFVRRSVPRG